MKYFVLFKEFNRDSCWEMREFSDKEKATCFLIGLDPKYHVRILESKELKLVKKLTLEYT